VINESAAMHTNNSHFHLYVIEQVMTKSQNAAYMPFSSSDLQSTCEYAKCVRGSASGRVNGKFSLCISAFDKKVHMKVIS
jgi:hypothetical protein